jgi:hypothetical protein
MKALHDANVDPELIEYAVQNVLFVAAAPHEWLFPRMSCTVHHGGIGTTASALRAGVPTIITPIMLDNYDNSDLVRSMGVGVGFEKRLADVTGEELGEAILHTISNKTMQQASRKLADGLLAEDGASQAAKEVEAFWEEYCVTGKFFEVFPGKAPFDFPKFVVHVSAALFLLLCIKSFYPRTSKDKFKKE